MQPEKWQTAVEVCEEDGPQAAEARRAENIKALLSNNLQVQRQPLLSKYLSIKEGEQVLKRAFRSPAPGAPAQSDALRRRLLARKHFVPWGSNKPFTLLRISLPPPPSQDLQQQTAVQPPPEDVTLPPGVEPLVLWEPAEAGGAASADDTAVEVDAMLTRWLRPHQRDGVQFMFDCVTGLRLPEGQGCILADDMGLGKTLQGISLMWTLLQQGTPALGGKPIAKRAIIVCPTSLVSNWDSECGKWLKGRCRTLALCESSRDDVIDAITRFTAPYSNYHCLIISYETFRLHSARLTGPGSCDLLICDEAHRLKNDATLTNRALDSLPCRRRVLLSGTPMQNHLDEFFAMVDFCNPGVLGSPAEFRKRYEAPILAGREPGASPEVAQLGESRSAELSGLVNNFILRRTNKLLSDHLPPKVLSVVVCKPTPLQQQLYEHFLLSNATRRLLAGSKAAGVLSAITCLKKLCNHPKLIYDTLHSKAQADGTVAEGFEGVGDLFPPGLFDSGRPGRGEMSWGWEELSGKMAFVARLLAVLRESTTDKVVIVSNYTQTLDLFATLCRQRGYQHVRLDGSTSINKRQKLVLQLNAPGSQVFVFLLSSKAGGCGLNLVGANRLILFDPDWNPAVDKQAAARVWRDGQKKRVYVYRMLTAGTIEEKVFQRQISKEGLQQVVDNAAAGAGGDTGALGFAAAGASADDSGSKGMGGGVMNVSLMSAEELRELFSLRPDVASDTYEVIRGGSERAAAAAAAAQAAAVGKQAETGNGGRSAMSEDEDGEADADAAIHIQDSDDDFDGNHGVAATAAAAAGLEMAKPPQCVSADADKAAGGAGTSASAMVDGYRPQIGQPSEEDLQNFGHHTADAIKTVPDEALQAAAGDFVSFVFSCQVAGRLDICQQQPPAAAGTGSSSRIGAAAGSSAGAGVSRSDGGSRALGKPRQSAPASLGGKRPLLAATGGARPTGGVAAGTAAHACQQRRHSVPTLPPLHEQQGAAQHQQGHLQQQQQQRPQQPQQQPVVQAAAVGQQQQAFKDASSRLNSSNSAIDSITAKQPQQQQPAKRQKIDLRANSKAAVADAEANGSWDEDEDDFM